MKIGRLETFLKKHGSWLIMAFMLTAVAPLYMYKSEFNTPFKFAFTFLTIPICALSFYVYLFQMPQYRSKTSVTKGSFMTLLFAAIAVLMSGGYVLLANACGPGQSETFVRGKIVDMSITRGRHSTSHLVTIDDTNGNNIKIEVTRQEYEQLAVGQRYSQTWRVGWLGLLYQ